MSRVYLDWNATAPLRPEAHAAMLDAMAHIGNPSSVHAEGRAALSIIEKSRAQVADLVGCAASEVVFTSGATEAIALVSNGHKNVCVFNGLEHDAVASWATDLLNIVDAGGVDLDACQNLPAGALLYFPQANSETGIRQSVTPPANRDYTVVQDMTQTVGKTDIGCDYDLAVMSSHKIGGPKGVGAAIIRAGRDQKPLLRGGGQEMGRRPGTENLVGIAGFGAAAAASKRDFDADIWAPVEKLRDQLEDRLMAAAPDLIIFGKDVSRLPNTSNFAIPGWKGEIQVMQMDLAGFAVSAGSACSSGKVKASRVLLAMGYDENTAGSAIRVSIGPATSEAELMAFADTWIEHYRRFKKRAA